MGSFHSIPQNPATAHLLLPVCWVLGTEPDVTGGAWGRGTAEAEVQEKDCYLSDPVLGCGSSLLTGQPPLSLFPRLQIRRTVPASPLVKGHTRMVYRERALSMVPSTELMHLK